jgi:alpha-acetolactate decarboxylase
MESNDKEPTFDFEFLTRSLNLIPYNGIDSLASDSTVIGAFNAAAITNIRFGSGGVATIKLFNGEVIMMNKEQLAELEATIKRRWAEVQESEAAAIQHRANMEAQASVNAASRAISEAAMMHKLKQRGS